jgi:DNA repair exonuclease SbcCD ATPase subunit
MTDVNTNELIRSSYVNSIGDLTLNQDHQTIQQRLNEASEKDHLKQEREENERIKADLFKRMADLKSKEESLTKLENSLKTREIALNSNQQSLQQKINEHKKEKKKYEQDTKKQIDHRNKISENLNERSRSLNQKEENLKEKSRVLDNREKRLETREVIANQNSLGVQVLEHKLTEIESRLTEGFLEIDEKIDSITLPQKKKLTKEKSNHNQIDFLSDKQSISLPEDYVFSLQDGEELGKCENLQDFISGIGRAKITGNIDDFLADFNFYFHDEGEPFFEVNIAELHENTQKDLIETFLKNT